MRAFAKALCFILALWLCHAASAAIAAPNSTGKLTISPNHRHLLEDGRPFLWIGDSAWALPARLEQPEVQEYLNNTAALGFNVVQMFSDAGWALDTSNRTIAGNLIYDNKDPRQLNANHFNHIAWIIDQASNRGIYSLLCVGGPAIRAEYRKNAPQYYNILDSDAKRYTYGHRLGQFFRSRNEKIIWCLSQDEPLNRDPYESGWNAMAEGIADGVNGESSDAYDGQANYNSTLMTFHGTNGTGHTPQGRSQSDFRHLPWLDLYSTYANNKILHDTALVNYGLSPAKPAFVIETRYESRLDNYGEWSRWWKRRADVYGRQDDHIDGHETRTHIYQSFQAGHMGFTYGHDEIYPFAPLGGYPGASARQGDWKGALDAPGRKSMAIAKAFYSSIPWTKLVPDQRLIVGGAGAGLRRIAAAYTTDGRYTTVYFPLGSVSRAIKFSRIEASHEGVEARWFNPSTGVYADIGTYPRTAKKRFFTSPAEWEGALLVLKGTDLIRRSSMQTVGCRDVVFANMVDSIVDKNGIVRDCST